MTKATTPRRAARRVQASVRLLWKTRVSQKRRAAVVAATKKEYPATIDDGEAMVITDIPKDDLRYVWLFMLMPDFRKIEKPNTNIRPTHFHNTSEEPR